MQCSNNNNKNKEQTALFTTWLIQLQPDDDIYLICVCVYVLATLCANFVLLNFCHSFLCVCVCVCVCEGLRAIILMLVPMTRR